MATRTIAIAKRFVDGCGGNTHIASLMHDGSVGGLSAKEAEPFESAFHIFDERATRLLFSILNATDSGFSSAVAEFAEAMRRVRTDLGVDDDGKEAKCKADSLPPIPGETPSSE